MAKLQRVTNKIFANNAQANEIGQFGSAIEGTKLETGDVATIQALQSWLAGWSEAAVSGNRYPALQEMNGVLKVMSYQTATVFQEGIPTFDSGTEYYKGSIVKKDGTFEIYGSLTDDNIGKQLNDETNWLLLCDLSKLKELGGGLEIGDIGTALYVDETKGLRRYLNGSILALTANTKGFQKFLDGLEATTPSLFTTEENWQAEAKLSVFGQCGKFVYNKTAGTVRLPKVVNIQGLQDLSKNGVRVNESLPQHTHYIGDRLPSITSAAGNPKADVNGNDGYPCVRISNTQGASSPIYKTNAPVQQEAIQYPYFIQIATGQETEANIVNEIELNNPYTLFDGKYSEAKLYNASWLLSNGQWNSGTVYVTAFEGLQVEQNSTVVVGTTVDLPSGSKYTKRGLSVKLNSETYTDYDFVINTTDQTFRLPLKTKLASGKAVVGNGMTLGLTNGTQLGGLQEENDNTIRVRMNAYGKPIGTSWQEGNMDDKTLGVTTDPTKSGIELSDSNLYLYYYIGETVQNANLINAGRIEEDLVNIKSLPHITETYVNGTSGYRLYSDHYIEQWGRNTKDNTTVTLLKAFKDTNYQIQIALDYGSGPDVSWKELTNSLTGNNRTTTTFQCGTRNGDWVAKGYIA